MMDEIQIFTAKPIIDVLLCKLLQFSRTLEKKIITFTCPNYNLARLKHLKIDYKEKTTLAYVHHM